MGQERGKTNITWESTYLPKGKKKNENGIYEKGITIRIRYRNNY